MTAFANHLMYTAATTGLVSNLDGAPAMMPTDDGPQSIATLDLETLGPDHQVRTANLIIGPVDKLDRLIEVLQQQAAEMRTINIRHQLLEP